MPREIRSAPLRYGLALASFALIFSASFVLQRILPFRVDLTSMIIIAMIASAWYLGLGPGLMLAIILELTLDYFSPPSLTFRSVFIIINRMVLFSSVVWFASSRRNAEKELRKQGELLQEALANERAMRQQAETSDRLKDEFLATVSHELRTPLSAILGWASMLNLGDLGEETRRTALNVIERNAKAQADIISDILDVSRIITGKLRIEARPIKLEPIINAAIETLQLAADAKGITITLAFNEDAGVVAGDPDRLQQIIWNLVANAIKFTPQNGGLKIELRRVDSQVELVVSDNGIGIDKEFLPHVFERFRQADSSRTRKHGGLGLGLAIVRHLVELHGGSVSAESPGEGMGTRVTVRLPLSTLADSTAEEQSTEIIEAPEPREIPMEPADLAGLRVLLVDDEPDTLDVLRAILNQFGATVRGASSTDDALETFLQWKPDVLVSDLGMPGEDGFALIAKVRALTAEQGRDIPAAALTAHVREEDRAQAIAAGYQTHIKKPVDPTRLAAAVAHLGKNVKKRSDGDGN